MVYYNTEVYKANLISEGKTRFICIVEYNENIIECYVPNTCKLSKLIPLSNNEILITKNLHKTKRTQYTLFAIKIFEEFLIVNTSIANKIVYNCILDKHNTIILPERKIENYKSDFYIPDKTTIVEVKSIISMEETLIIPNGFSIRAINQLEKLNELLKNEYSVDYYFVVFDNNCLSITLNTTTEYGNRINFCVEQGMNLKVLICKYNESENIIEVINSFDKYDIINI